MWLTWKPRVTTSISAGGELCTSFPTVCTTSLPTKTHPLWVPHWVSLHSNRAHRSNVLRNGVGSTPEISRSSYRRCSSSAIDFRWLILIINPCEKCQRRYIVAYAMAPYSSHWEKDLSQNKFIKRYKGSNFIAKEFKKLFLCLTFCFYAGWCRDSVYTW